MKLVAGLQSAAVGGVGLSAVGVFARYDKELNYRPDLVLFMTDGEGRSMEVILDGRSSFELGQVLTRNGEVLSNLEASFETMDEE